MSHGQSAAGRGPRAGAGRLRRRDADGVTTTLGRGGSDLLGGDLRRLPRRRRNPDLDRRRRDADRRSAHRRRAVRWCRTCRLPRRRSWPISAPRCCIRRPSSRRSPATSRSASSTRIAPRRAARSSPASGRPAIRPLTALASKSTSRVVDITSTRMLMAHGFLRRLFEVFERYKTPVDVVTTSEVSVSVTVDDRRRLPAIVEALSEFAEVDARARRWPSSARSARGCRREPALVGRVLRASETSRSIGVAGGISP